MNLPIEVWDLIFTYLRLIDLVEISCVCKTFYDICEKNQYYVKILRESKDIFKDRTWLIETYKQLLERFYLGVYKEIVVGFPVSHVHVFRKTIYSQLCYSSLPFRVWNHVFLCCRSQYESDMCLFCAKLCLKNKKVNLTITKKLKIGYFENFPVSLYCSVTSSDEINLFVHSSSQDRQKLYGPNNFGTLFYEVISSPFLLWKFYLDVLDRIVLNHCDKFILPALLSGFDTNECKISTVCNSENCFGFKKVKIREINSIKLVFLHPVTLSKRLATYSCQTVNSDFIIKVFDTYKCGVDFYNPYLSIDRYQEEIEKDE